MWMEGSIDYMIKTRVCGIREGTAKSNDFYEVDATEPVGLKFESSVCREAPWLQVIWNGHSRSVHPKECLAGVV
jgi:hypothetical protein